MTEITDPIALFIALGQALQELKTTQNEELASWVEDVLSDGNAIDVLTQKLRGKTVESKWFSPSTTKAKRDEADAEAEVMELQKFCSERLKKQYEDDVKNGVEDWLNGYVQISKEQPAYTNPTYYEYVLPIIGPDGRANLTPDGFAYIVKYKPYSFDYVRHVTMVASMFGFTLNGLVLDTNPKPDAITVATAMIPDSPAMQALWTRLCASLDLAAPKWSVVLRRMRPT